MTTTKCNVEFSKDLQSFCTAGIQKKYLAHLYINLVETFALILNLKIVFKYLLWVQLSILQNALHALKPLLTHTKKQAYSF